MLSEQSQVKELTRSGFLVFIATLANQCSADSNVGLHIKINKHLDALLSTQNLTKTFDPESDVDDDFTVGMRGQNSLSGVELQAAAEKASL